MTSDALAQNPFTALSLIAAPALLTNATCLLAMSTINRMLRTRDRMHDLYRHSQTATLSATDAGRLLEDVNRVETQALLLLRALRCIYVALGAFAAASLATLLGAILVPSGGIFPVIAGVGMLLGFIGVSGLVLGSTYLFRATQISLANIREEAARIREHQARRT